MAIFRLLRLLLRGLIVGLLFLLEQIDEPGTGLLEAVADLLEVPAVKEWEGKVLY